VWLDTELNKINAAALALIEADADTSNAPVTSEKTAQTPAQNTSTLGNNNQKTAVVQGNTTGGDLNLNIS